VPAAQGEFVHTDHPWDRLLRQRQASQMAQCGTAGDGHGQQTSEACGRPPDNSCATWDICQASRTVRR
jgi:hypothetical protein